MFKCARAMFTSLWVWMLGRKLLGMFHKALSAPVEQKNTVRTINLHSVCACNAIYRLLIQFMRNIWIQLSYWTLNSMLKNTQYNILELIFQSPERRWARLVWFSYRCQILYVTVNNNARLLFLLLFLNKNMLYPTTLTHW